MQNLLNKIIKDFEKVERPEDAERLGKKAWGMIQQYHLVMCGAEKASQAVKNRIIDRMTQKALTWDTDDASLSSVQKMFNRLASGRYSDAVNLADSSIRTKKGAERTALKKNAKNANEKRHAKNNATREKAMAWFLKNKSLYEGRGGKLRAAIDLEEKFPPIKRATYTQHLKKIK
jgi:hypothetical protein